MAILIPGGARGSVFDVAVDIGPDSATCGRWASVKLTGYNKEMWVPAGMTPALALAWPLGRLEGVALVEGHAASLGIAEGGGVGWHAIWAPVRALACCNVERASHPT